MTLKPILVGKGITTLTLLFGLGFIVQNPKPCLESHLPYLPSIPGFPKICQYLYCPSTGEP